LLPGVVQSHKDVADSYYLQIIGKSFWKIDGLHVFELSPGDVMFISKTVTHEVSGNGPRSGILITDARKVSNK
jgi:mannose-6-phosphate isomerase-like protein (cupin superfamily)